MGKPWKEIKQVNIEEIPPARRNDYYQLYEELCLRLEQTTTKYALMITFDTHKNAKLTYNALIRHFNKRKGKGFVTLSCRRLDGRETVLYVSRGPEWRYPDNNRKPATSYGKPKRKYTRRSTSEEDDE